MTLKQAIIFISRMVTDWERGKAGWLPRYNFIGVLDWADVRDAMLGNGIEFNGSAFVDAHGAKIAGLAYKRDGNGAVLSSTLTFQDGEETEI